MATEVERLQKEAATLESKRAEHEHKHEQAQGQKTLLEGKRREMLVKIAEGDDAARRDIRGVVADLEQAAVDAEAFGEAATTVASQLESTRKKLARAEREAAITALELQMAGLAECDNNVEAALALLRVSSNELFAATAAVATELTKLDPERYDSHFGYGLSATIKEAIAHRFEELPFPNVTPRPPFIARADSRLRAALAQLRHEALGTDIVPARGEKLYRTVGRITGIRDLDLRSGSLIALRDDEAKELVGSLVLEPEVSDDEAHVSV